MTGVRTHPAKRSLSFQGNVDRVPRTAEATPTTVGSLTNRPSEFDKRQQTSFASSVSSRLTGITTRTGRTTSTRPTSTRASPTYTTSPTPSNNPFHLTTLAAIIVPALIVLAILSWACRRWRRTVAARSGGGEVIVVQHPPLPKQKIGDSPHPYGGSFGGSTRVDNDFDRPFHSGSVPPQPIPGPGSGYQYGNAGMQGNWGSQPFGSGPPQPVQSQVWNSDYGQPYGQQNDVYNQQHYNFGPQSHHDYGQQSHDYGQPTHSAPIPQPQQPIVAPTTQLQHPTPSPSHVYLQPPSQPQQLIASQSSISLKPQAESHSKSDVVLGWVPDIGTSSNAIGAPSPSTQQAGSSNGNGTEAQSPGSPELHMLRERVQLLEAALVVQPAVAHDDAPDRPPPAYDEHPDHVMNSRTGGRS